MNALAISIVLIHGGFVDGSGWQGVYDALKKDGYNVSVVQNPTTSLADDVAFTKRVVAAQKGKGHAAQIHRRQDPAPRTSRRAVVHVR